MFKRFAFRLAVLTIKNAWSFDYSVICMRYSELFMNRSVGELYNIVTTLNIWDLVTFDKFFRTGALL